MAAPVIPPEIIAKANRNRAFLKANPKVIDELLADMIPESREPAKKIMEVFMSTDDLMSMGPKMEAIKAGLSPAVIAELEAHKDDVDKRVAAGK